MLSWPENADHKASRFCSEPFVVDSNQQPQVSHFPSGVYNFLIVTDPYSFLYVSRQLEKLRD